MADVLSQTEVESLLSALDPVAKSQSSQVAAPARREELHTPIAVYDFKRPERVSKEQMRALQALHEGFSRELGANLSGMLRTIVEVKLISVDQLTYSEFVFSLENPTCFNLLHSGGLDGNIILDLNPSILFPIVDRLLGGGKQARPSTPGRPLTEIELRLVNRVTNLAIRGLETAWSNVCELDLKVSQVESNPQLVQIVPPNEVIVLISFEVMMGEARGIMNLCIPFNTIEPLASKLSSDTWSTYSRREADPRQKLNLEAGVSRAAVTLVVELARTSLKVSELASLAPGDVIMTDTDTEEGATVLLKDRPLFRAAPGTFRDLKAVRMTAPVTQPAETVAGRLRELGIEESDDSSAKTGSL